MKVAELISELQKVSPELEVVTGVNEDCVIGEVSESDGYVWLT